MNHGLRDRHGRPIPEQNLEEQKWTAKISCCSRRNALGCSVSLAARRQDRQLLIDGLLLADIVEQDELVITAPDPAAWCAVDLARKHRHDRRDRDVHGMEVAGQRASNATNCTPPPRLSKTAGDTAHMRPLAGGLAACAHVLPGNVVRPDRELFSIPVRAPELSFDVSARYRYGLQYKKNSEIFSKPRNSASHALRSPGWGAGGLDRPCVGSRGPSGPIPRWFDICFILQMFPDVSKNIGPNGSDVPVMTDDRFQSTRGGVCGS